MKKEFKAKETFVKSFLVSPYIYENYYSDVKDIFNDLKIFQFSADKLLDFAESDFNQHIIYVLSGDFSILYNKKTIQRIIVETPFLLGETSFLKMIFPEKNYPRIGTVYSNKQLTGFILALKNFFNYSPVLKELIVENVLINLFKKITYMNNKLEKLSNIYSKIQNFFLEDTKKNITELTIEIKKILSGNINKKSVSKGFKKNLEIDDIKSYLSNKKEDIYKRFYFIKNNIAPFIESINDEKLIFFIARDGKWVKFQKGEVLCYQGEANNGCFYIVINGGVDIIVNNSKINELEGIFLVGEMALIGNIKGNYAKRSATVKFNKESIVIVTKMDKYFKYNKNIKLKFSGTIMHQMLKRLESTNKSFLKYLEQINHFLENLKKSGEISENNINIIRDTINQLQTIL